MGSVAIEDGCVASADLTGMVEDDDLGVERLDLLGGVVLRIGGDVASTDFLDGNVLDVEADIITGVALLELLVMHFDGLDFSGNVAGGEGDNHAGLDDTSLDTADGHCANTTNLVDVLERETEGLVGRTDGGLNGIDGLEEGLALDDITTLDLLGPTLEPGHAATVLEEKKRLDQRHVLGGLLQHVVSVPARDGHEGDSLGVVTNLLDEGGGFLDNFVETIFAPL